MFVPASATSTAVRLIIFIAKDSPELSVLQQLPQGVEVVGIGRTAEEFAALTEEQLAGVNVLLTCGVGTRAALSADIQAVWPKLTALKWMHSASAGVEHLLFPDLVEGPVVLTNAKGVYSHSLGEWAITACNWFAKDLPRLRVAQKQKKWEQYEVEELRGKTLGIIGYGDIGQAVARIGRAFRMRVVALRRHTQLSAEEQREGVVERMYAPSELGDLVAACDYVVMATPWTPDTDKMLTAEAIARMKPTGVFINVGRGKCVDEPALIKALQEGRIRGAALDVFATEPLPPDSPLWQLDNVLLSPHCADRTKEFQFESLQFFLENLKGFIAGQELRNVVDKRAGY